MNVFFQRALNYLGITDTSQLSKTDLKRVRAKAKKMKTSDKKAERKCNKL